MLETDVKEIVNADCPILNNIITLEKEKPFLRTKSQLPFPLIQVRLY